MFEEWHPGSGLELIKAGFNIFTVVNDLSLDQMLLLFQLLVKLSNFHSTNFVEEAEIFRRDKDSDPDLYINDVVQDFKENIKRNLALGKGVTELN